MTKNWDKLCSDGHLATWLVYADSTFYQLPINYVPPYHCHIPFDYNLSENGYITAVLGVLGGHTVAMITYCVTKMIPTCSPMIGQFFDTMIVASSDKEWL